MLNHKFGILGAVTLGLVVYSQAAMAAEVVITTPNQVTTNTDLVHQAAAPTRYFNVEKAVTLGQGQDRLGASLQLGGLGTSTGVGLTGGVNLRDDIGLTPNLEAGINVQGLGANNGASSLIGNIGIDGKLGFTDFMMGSTPVSVGGLATLGAAGVSGGLGSVNLAVGVPLTAAFTSAFSLTVVPGIGYGFASSNGVNNGSSGFTPAVGLGADYAFTDRLSALIDTNVGFSNGFTAGGGNLGVRYGFTDNLAADLFLGYQNNPISSLNTGSVGLGGYYAF
jgi:hypothetical protein